MPAVAPPAAWTEVKGIFVGGCVERGDGSSFRHRRTRTHTAPTTPGLDLHSRSQACGAERQAARLLIHEYAHILQPSAGHGPAWQKRVALLGAPSEAKAHLKSQAAFKARQADYRTAVEAYERGEQVSA